MSDQLGFHLPSKAATGREDFFISPANSLAVATIEDWQNWPGRKLILTGARGSGKTHLAYVWAADTGAKIVSSLDLDATNVDALAKNNCLVVEDIPDIAGHAAQEDALFHLHNLIMANEGYLLMTGENAPSRWPLALPDLASRIEGTSVVQLEKPDDALLSAVLLKLFADRQLTPAPTVIGYLVANMDRSFEMAGRVVAHMDNIALADRRKLNRGLAADVLDILRSDET